MPSPADERGFWDRLGMDEGGLCIHLPMGVNKEGNGPENDVDAHHVECWCGDSSCQLSGALMWAWRLGRKEGLNVENLIVGGEGGFEDA